MRPTIRGQVTNRDSDEKSFDESLKATARDSNDSQKDFHLCKSP